jgi:aryl-alcohol dehydrogenase-like predicted oxidoreductase
MDGGTQEPRSDSRRNEGARGAPSWVPARLLTHRALLQYTTQFKKHDGAITQKIHYGGNSAKALRISVEASLAKLRTDYIDILYVHWWDWSTSVEEVMNALHHLVAAGKVLYLVRVPVRCGV